MEFEQQTLNQNALEVTTLGSVGIAAVYSVVVALALLFPTPWDTTLTIALTAGVAVFAWLSWAWIRWRPLRPERAHGFLFLLQAAMAVHTGAVLYLIGDPIHTGNQILALMAAALFFAARAWFYPAVVLVAVCWLPAALAGWQSGLVVDDWSQWARMLTVSVALAVVFFEARRRTVLRTYRLKLEAESALTRAQLANESRLDMQRMMEESQRREALGVLAGGIAHDFNNLLTVVRGNLELLLPRADETDDTREILVEMDKACARAVDLTRQMLVYAGRSRPKIGTIPLGRRIRSAVQLIESSIAANVAIVLQGSDHGPDLRVDSTLLDQLVLNVIQNAVEACADQGGTVRIRWGATTMNAQSLAELDFADPPVPGRYAEIEVTDDGVGMDEATQRRMFEPFFTSKTDGNGLGLAVATGILHSHAAGVAVLSSPGEGTTFRCAIPMTPALAEFGQ